MTDSFRKRKWAGPPVRELRKVDQVPVRVPPHKKPRNYVLTVEWREEQVLRCAQSFTSKDAMKQARIRLERDIKEKKSLWWWRHAREERIFNIKEGPTFTERMDEP